MKHGLMMKAAALVACGGLAAALGGPGCDTLGLGDGGAGGSAGSGGAACGGAGGYGGGGGGGYGCDAPIETGLKVFCKKPDWGVTCQSRCFDKGIGCVWAALHPYKADAGTGKLFSCNDLTIGYMCGYHYDNGDDCYFPFGKPGMAWCSYSGNG